jgi:Uma2 family endonuclease
MIARTWGLDATFDFMPDDTEETLVGASPHQDAIYILYDGLQHCGPDRGLPWFVGNQITMIIPRRQGRPAYQPSPDILVHPTLTDAERSSLDVDRDGPPALIIEVASPATARERDLNPAAKPGIYAAINVLEYLVFDPLEQFIAGRVWARRLGLSGYDLWLPGAHGRWESAALGISFLPAGSRLRIYDQQGLLVPTRLERSAEARRLLEQNSQLASQNSQLANQNSQLAVERTRLTEEVVRRERMLEEERNRRAELEAELRRLRGE